jgi:hypothetical protein
LDEQELIAIEEVDNPFANIDYRWFETTSVPPEQDALVLQTVG